MKKCSCPKYGKDLERGSMAAHCQTQNGVAKGVIGKEGEVFYDDV